VNSLRHPKEDRSDQECMLTALGSLWSAGVQVEWSRLHGDQERRRIPLPTYAFERKRFWIDPPAASSARAGISEMRRTGASESFSVAAQPDEQDKSSALASSARATEGSKLASRGEIEKRLSMLWQEVLGVQQIGIHDNFFELGGQSLMGVTLVNEITQLFGRRFPLQTLLNAPTVHQFSEVILKEQESGGQSGRDGGSNSIADQVRSFIMENYPPSGELRNSDSFSEFGIINEESILHLISFLEETYGFTVPDSDFNSGNIDSIDSISRYVLYRRNGGREKTVAGAES
jgi:acyl carrier protein